MRSLGIAGAFITLIALVSVLLDHWANRIPSEREIILLSRFLVITVGTCSALLATVQAPPAPIRVSRIALYAQHHVRRYTHEMFAASLVQEVNATFLSGASRRSGTYTGIRTFFHRCTYIPTFDLSRRWKARSVDAVCLRRGHTRA